MRLRTIPVIAVIALAAFVGPYIGPFASGNLLAEKDTVAARPELDFPTRGFQIQGELPKAWRRLHANNDQIAARWFGDGSTPTDIRALVQVEVFRGNEKPLAEFAKRLAGAWQGEILSEKREIAGEAALKIVAGNTTDELRPVVGVVTQHGGFIYLVSGHLLGAAACDEFVESIVKGWKWRPLLHPSDCLDVFAEPDAVFGTRFTFNYPRAMSRQPVDDLNNMVQLGLLNMQRRVVELIVTASIRSETEEIEFNEATRNALIQKLTAEFPLDEAARWLPTKSDPSGWVTKPATSTAANKSAGKKVYFKWAVIPLKLKEYILVVCIIKPANDEELARYDAAANAIVDSFQLVKLFFNRR